MSTNDPTFYIEVTTGPVAVRKSEIWPDGDGPENPTAWDVERLFSAQGRDPMKTAEEWGLTIRPEVFISKRKGS